MNICVFDTETTGVDTRNDRIVSAYLAIVNAHGSILSEHYWLMNPEVDIPSDATKVHHITNSMVNDAPKTSQCLVEMKEWFATYKNVPVVIFNAPFDTTIFTYECERRGLLDDRMPSWDCVIDPSVIDRHFHPLRRSGGRNLSVTAAGYGIDIGTGAHNAKVDAITTGLLAFTQLNKFYGGISTDLVCKLQGLQQQWRYEQAIEWENHLRLTDEQAFIEKDWPVLP